MYLKDKSKLKPIKAMPYKLWKTRAVINFINGYEVLIFVDSQGSTGVCVRKEEEKLKKDFINIGQLDQLYRGDPNIGVQLNSLDWHLTDIRVIYGYDKFGFCAVHEDFQTFDNVDDLQKRLPAILDFLDKSKVKIEPKQLFKFYK